MNLNPAFNVNDSFTDRKPQAKKVLLVETDFCSYKDFLSKSYRNDNEIRFEFCLIRDILIANDDFDAIAFGRSVSPTRIRGLIARMRLSRSYEGIPKLVVLDNERFVDVEKLLSMGVDDFISPSDSPSIISHRISIIERNANQAQQTNETLNALKKYVSAPTVSMIRDNRGQDPYGDPSMIDLCVLFSDLRGFTQLSDTVDANYLFSQLSKHLGTQADIVHNYGGYVDKFAGDGIMAVFDGGDYVGNACQCAREILSTSKKIFGKDAEEFRFGIGIHVGQALIGSLGSDHHRDYSVIGKTINLSARLCGEAEPNSAVVSNDVVLQLDGAWQKRFRNKRQVSVKGINGSVTVHDMIVDEI